MLLEKTKSVEAMVTKGRFDRRHAAVAQFPFSHAAGSGSRALKQGPP